MTMNNSILLTLASGKPVSIGELTAKAGISRDIIGTHLESLIEAGLDIKQDQEAIHWINPFSCLDSRLILKGLTDYEGLCITVADSLPSTNTVLTETGLTDKAILLCEHQSAGRGRHQRQWLSPIGKNLYLSFGWDLKIELLHPAISLCIGAAMVSVLKRAGVMNAGMKWPNDLYASHAKIGGILIESKADRSVAKLVIGVGINVFEQNFPDDLSVAATTIEQETGSAIDRNNLVIEVIAAIYETMQKVEAGQIKQLLDGWSEYDLSYNQAVDVHAQGAMRSGVARGIDARGNLRVEIEDKLEVFDSAEISLRITK